MVRYLQTKRMDPLSLFSIFLKITTFDVNKDKNFTDQELYNKSRTEIIDLYRSAMTKKQQQHTNFN